MKVTSGNWYNKKTKTDLSSLHCPECNSTYLHQSTIGIYNCDEDADTGLHLEVNHTNFTMDNKMEGNPSPRRHGLSIHFWCENCGEEHPGHIFNIFQHKGETFMGWENK